MKKIILLFAMTAMIIAVKPAEAQNVTYQLYLDSVVAAGTDSLAYKVVLKNTTVSSDTFSMSSLTAVFAFDYGHIANKGALTVGYVSGSASTTLPTNQKSPTIAFNSTTLQMTITVPSAVSASAARKIPKNGTITVGWFYVKNSVNFTDSTQSHLSWVFPQTQLLVYINRNTTRYNLTLPASHYVQMDPALNP
jgi:hypothetical protein